MIIITDDDDLYFFEIEYRSDLVNSSTNFRQFSLTLFWIFYVCISFFFYLSLSLSCNSELDDDERDSNKA